MSWRRDSTALEKVVTLVYFAAVVVFFVVVLTSIGCSRVPTKPAAVNASCDSACFTACTGKGGDTGIRWDGTPVDPAAWDLLAGAVVPDLIDALRTCESSRAACATCLGNLREQGVIQ